VLDVHWTTARDEQGVTIRLSGELDVAGCPAVDEALQSVEDEGSGRLVIDLRGLRFIDSSGLRVIVGAHQRAVAAGRDLSVLIGEGTVARAMALTKLDEILPLEMATPAASPPA
jgi:anti-sigma B factor antagonist